MALERTSDPAVETDLFLTDRRKPRPQDGRKQFAELNHSVAYHACGSRFATAEINRRSSPHFPVGASCRQAEPAIFAAAITACVRLSTPSFCRMAETCALMVASETPSS